MAKQNVWIAYDLDSAEANYDDLYKWIAEHNALECTNSTAFIKDYEYDKDICKEMAEDIRNHVKHVKRVYLLYKNGKGEYEGRFIIGKREKNPWKDYESKA